MSYKYAARDLKMTSVGTMFKEMHNHNSSIHVEGVRQVGDNPELIVIVATGEDAKAMYQKVVELAKEKEHKIITEGNHPS